MYLQKVSGFSFSCAFSSFFSESDMVKNIDYDFSIYVSFLDHAWNCTTLSISLPFGGPTYTVSDDF